MYTPFCCVWWHHTQPVLQGCQAEIPAKKLKRGHRKKNFWPNFGWFYQKQAEKGPQKIFKRSSLFLAVITVINLIFNIQYTNFLRPLFCLFLVKISQNSARNFFVWPLLSFLAGISAWQPCNTISWTQVGGWGLPRHTQYTCSSGNGVARLLGRNSGQKAQKGPQKKISGRILADFTKNRQKRGRR